MACFPPAGAFRTPNGVTFNIMEQLGKEWDGAATGKAIDVRFEQCVDTALVRDAMTV